MKYSLFITIVIIILSLISCDRSSIYVGKDDKSTIIDQNKINENENMADKEEIYTIVDVKNINSINKPLTTPMVLELIENWKSPRKSDKLYFIVNELNDLVTDFSSYDIHPLDCYLGKWVLLNNDGSINERNRFIRIYNNDTDYRYHFEYGSIDNGIVLFSFTSKIILLSDNKQFIKRIIGEPMKVKDEDTWAIFIHSEGPLGYFKRVIDE